MEITKIFSNIEDPEENLYSVLMSEDEVALFSEFQKEFAVGVGIKKAVDNHKEKKLLKEYREQLKTYSIFSRFFPKKNEVPNYLGLPIKISGKINQENLGKEIWENEMKEWEYSPLNSKYKKTDFQKFLKNLDIEKVPKKDWLGDDEELTVCLKDDFYLGWWNICLDKNGKISNIAFND